MVHSLTWTSKLSNRSCWLCSQTHLTARHSSPLPTAAHESSPPRLLSGWLKYALPAVFLLPLPHTTHSPHRSLKHLLKTEIGDYSFAYNGFPCARIKPWNLSCDLPSPGGPALALAFTLGKPPLAALLPEPLGPQDFACWYLMPGCPR